MTDNLSNPYNRRRVLTIDDLTDDDLLAIFDFFVVRYQDLAFCVLSDYNTKREVESWQSLVHVCRRWRCLVFGSPRRLNLQLYARKSLDVWPALPLLIEGYVHDTSVDDVIAGLEHSDRIRQIDLNWITNYQFEDPWIQKLLTAMEVPFPELTALSMSIVHSSNKSVLPDSFLGGSAPRLRYFYLHAIPFPGLPKLLLSATHLVKLRLLDTPPRTGYITPETMVTCLSMLTSLESLHLGFEYQRPYPDLKSRRSFPPIRYILPTLTDFLFYGLNEYLDQFLAQIDAPQLYLVQLSTAFPNGIDSNTPELNQFITRTPTLGAYDEAHLIFGNRVRVRLRQFQPERSDHRMARVEVEIVRGWKVEIMAKICTSSLRPLLTMENLYIDMTLSSPLVWEVDNESTRWLDLLLLFTAVKNLYLSKTISPRIALALQESTGGRTEVLPSLQNVLLEGFQPSEPVQEGLAQFISARQLTNHPVTISVWNRDRGLL